MNNRWKIVKVLSTPARIVWEVTNRCNLKCRYCYIGAGDRADKELSTSDVIDLAKTIGQMGVFHVTLSGGEPLIRKDIFQIINILCKYDVAVFLNSNGTLIDKNIAQKIKNSGLNGVAISIDGITAKTHEELRPPNGSFKKVLYGLQMLNQMDINTGIQVTMTKTNYHEMLGLVDFCLSSGVSGVKFSRVSPIGRGSKNFEEIELPYKIAQKLVTSLYNKKIELAGKLRIDFGENLVSQFIGLDSCESLDAYTSECEAGRYKCAISAEGDIRPCEFFIDDKYCAGNVNNLSFYDIWQKSSVFDYFRTDNLYSDCAICRKHCPARCPAVAVYAGDHTSIDPTCPYQLMRKEYKN